MEVKELLRLLRSSNGGDVQELSGGMKKVSKLTCISAQSLGRLNYTIRNDASFKDYSNKDSKPIGFMFGTEIDVEGNSQQLRNHWC